MTRPLTPWLGAMLALAAAHPAAATTTRYHAVSGFSELARGEPTTTALTAEGEVTLAAPAEKVADGLAAQILAIVADGRGGVYVATGEPGRVMHVSAKGETRTVFEAKEPLVTSLALRDARVLYAATAPEGRVYKIDPKTKESSVYFAPPGKYLWALALDGSQLYAAAGLEGAVYRVARKGVGEPFGALREKHVRSLAVGGRAGARRVVAGGGAKGIVYLLEGDDGVRALFDSPLEEITAVVIDKKGVIYAAAVNASEAEGSEDLEELLKVADEGGGSEPSVREVKSSEVYRITPDGDVRLLWKSKKDGAYALALDRGDLLIGTGGRGRLYRVSLSARYPLSLEAKLGAAEITSMVSTSKGLLIATSAPGALFRRGAGRAREGVYLSAPLDAKRPARYGALRAVVDARNGTSVRFDLRHGNTATIDETWGPFVELRQGEAGPTTVVSRYVQVRATLRGAGEHSPTLRGFELAYRTSNRAPRLRQIEVLSPGVRVEPMPDDEPKGRTFSVSGGSFDDFLFVPGKALVPEEPKPRARQTFERGWRTLVWEGEDEDGDRLLFDVQLRSLEDGREIALGRGLDHGFVTFAADRLPDGRYQAWVEATDRPDNSAKQALGARRESQPFLIDHTPPRIVRLRAEPVDKTARVMFESVDASPLRGAWCSQDGGAWVAVEAEDGLSDEVRESFRGEIPLLAAPDGRATIIRCAIEDLVGNRGLAELRLR